MCDLAFPITVLDRENQRQQTAATISMSVTFPLPAQGAMYDGLVATLNSQDVLPDIQIKDASLVLEREVTPDEVMDFRIAFKSRGLSSWDFQVREAREIRDFTLTLTLPDLAKSKLNYPDGCMPPNDIKPMKDNQGSVRTYRLDHALTDKGMGIALPQLAQPRWRLLKQTPRRCRVRCPSLRP